MDEQIREFRSQLEAQFATDRRPKKKSKTTPHCSNCEAMEAVMEQLIQCNEQFNKAEEHHAFVKLELSKAMERVKDLEQQLELSETVERVRDLEQQLVALQIAKLAVATAPWMMAIGILALGWAIVLEVR